MSLSVAGVWQVGVWDQTVWADGVWREGTPAVVATTRAGGGRIIGALPTIRLKKREVKVEVIKPDDQAELIARLKAIDAEYQKKRELQYRELLEILRAAIYQGTQVTLQGFDLLREADIKRAKRKIQDEEESILLLLQ